MRILQMLTFSICLLLVIKNTAAVVNNGAISKSSLESSTSTTETKDTSSSEITVDAVASSSETEANKREAIIDLSENFATAGILNGIYGPPIDSYLPPATSLSSVNLPLPVYGVPSIGPNVIYPTPPPDIPPALSSLSLAYGVPTTGIKDFYIPPKFTYAPIKTKPIRTKYGLPLIQRPPKPLPTTTFHFPKTPKPVYGPPRIIKPNFNKIPKLQYGPPKPQYGPPPKLTYGPPKQVQVQTTTVYIPPSGGALINPQIGGTVLTPPPLTQAYGPPQITINGPTVQPTQQYGPPEPVVHGPPHPGIPAPPTPPDIKYDGWQPIPGLVSRPPSDTYGPPNHGSNEVNDLQINTDFIPPPPAGGGAGIHSLSLQESYKGNGVVSDSYGAPLNTVTGSGGVVATSGEEHHQQNQGSLNIIENQLSTQHQEQHDHKSNLNLGLSAIGIGGGQDNSLSVIKSVGYQLFPSYALGYSGAYLNGVVDSYGAPPANSYSPTGPYPSASYKTNSLASTSSTEAFGSAYNALNSHSFGKEISLSPTGVGLIPPSGLYGVTPSSQYGTPLFQPTNQHFHAPKYHPPRRPIVFREPVPVGLIQSIGNAVSQKDASGVIDTIHTSNVGPAYIPPPVPEVAKLVREPPEPSGLYSLPHVERPISFQNVVHGSSTAGLSHQFADSFNLNTVGSDYNFGVIDGAYALPLQTSTIAFNTNQNLNNQQQNYHLEQSKQVNYNQLNGGLAYNTYSLQNSEPYQNVQHDCNSYNSQPVPQLTYGAPSANGYSDALYSLNTNIGSGYQNQHSFAFGGSSDLQTSHSQSAILLSSSSNANSISEVTKDNYGKSLGESFANGGELIKSQSLDLNNIPLQGALGTYTLQIQPAGGLGNIRSNSGDVPHEQVLNDGLLQSILAAIEHPEQNQQSHLGADPILQVQADQSQVYSQIATAPAELVQNSAEVSRSDVEAQQSVKNLVVTPPLDSTASANETKSQQNDFGDLGLIDNNEIALYFNNTNIQQQSDDLDTEQEIDDPEDVRNAQQYGSYVSFKTPSASYVYGNLKADDQQKDVKDGDDSKSS